jgi:arsenical pump membrane protein
VEWAAYPALFVAVGLVLTRPRILGQVRVGPATAASVGALAMLASGVVHPADVVETFRDLWRPFVGVAAIMVLAAGAEKVGILDRIAGLIERRTQGTVGGAFLTVFVLASLTATLFNNDAAVLLLTPAVVALVKRRYPLRQYLVVPFAFAVFMAAGVAPLVISNPMNMVVAAHAGIGFNEYAMLMIPVWLVGSAVGFAVLRRQFHKDVDDAIPGRGPLSPPLPAPSAAEIQLFVLLVVVLGTYPVVSYLGGPVWAVAAGGALLTIVLLAAHRAASPNALLGAVSWDILVFLFGAFVMAIGLRNAGVVGGMTSLYASLPGGAAGEIFGIGVTSAVGSAVLNNHPTAVLNALALEGVAGAERRHVLAALIGGDLGPRLLPIGSLAGLLWLKQLRRAGIEIGLAQYVRIGAAVTIPTLLVSLAVLLLLS